MSAQVTLSGHVENSPRQGAAEVEWAKASSKGRVNEVYILIMEGVQMAYIDNGRGANGGYQMG
jgi:hypothetical protein